MDSQIPQNKNLASKPPFEERFKSNKYSPNYTNTTNFQNLLQNKYPSPNSYKHHDYPLTKHQHNSTTTADSHYSSKHTEMKRSYIQPEVSEGHFKDLDAHKPQKRAPRMS